MKQRSPKKNDTLEVRLPSETKTAFMEACKANGVSGSGVLRGCIDNYLLSGSKARQRWKETLSRTVLWARNDRRAFATAAGALVSILLISLAATPSRAAPDARLVALFEAIDANHDSKISPAEFQVALRSQAPAPFGAVKLLVSTKARVSPAQSGAGAFEQIDVNRDGVVVLHELLSTCAARTVATNGIVTADTNRNGGYTEGELAAYLTAQSISAGRGSPSSAALMARGIILEHDTDGDGEVFLGDLRR